jgi:hypothetical protein
VGKINILLYEISPSVSEYIANPDGLSLILKYLPAIKTNPSILILAYPKWSVPPMAIFTTDATSICAIHTPYLSLSLSLSLPCLAHSPLLSVSYR